MVNAIKDFNIGLIIVFASGCLIGLLSFSRLISWVLKKYHNVAIGVLSGFMIGSLGKIWPWKEVFQYRLNSSGEQVPMYERNIMPNQFLEITGNDPHFLYALLFIFIGIFGVILFERIATWSTSKY